MAFSVAKFIGVLYLGWLAVPLWRSKSQALRLESTVRLSPLLKFLRSLLVAISNPKVLLFFSALRPQFVDPAQPQAVQYLALAALFTVIDASGGARADASGLRLLNRACAGALLVLAGLLAPYRKSAP